MHHIAKTNLFYSNFESLSNIGEICNKKETVMRGCCKMSSKKVPLLITILFRSLLPFGDEKNPESSGRQYDNIFNPLKHEFF